MSSDIKIYRDTPSNAVVAEVPSIGAGGMAFVNELRAVLGDVADSCSIIHTKRGVDDQDFFEVSNVPWQNFVDENGDAHGTDDVTTCNALNAILQQAGSGGGSVPVITSATTVNVTAGDTINYELTADYGVGYEWSGLPSGLVTVDGNPRKLVGGSSLAVGTYNVTATAVNYFGEDSETIAFVVSAPPFSNTKSVKFSNQDYMGANAALLDAELGRTSNGSGSGDAWTISLWFKASSENQGQTLFYFGNNDVVNNGYIELRQTNNAGQKRLRFRYGSNGNHIQLNTPSGSLTPGTWQHLLVTYDGGTTGVASGSVSDYYSRFAIRIDDTAQTLSASNANYGYSGSIVGQNLRVGRFSAGGHLRQAYVDELAIWGSDQTAASSDIYNSGTPHDLSVLTTAPDHWWRFGDGDTYPNIQDQIGNAHFVMYNMTAADIVNDVP